MESVREKELLSGISLKAYCHIYPCRSGVRVGKSFCGVPSEECPEHRPVRDVGFYTGFSFCPYCGLENCPKCRRLG